MEHIGEILKQTRINTSRASTDTWSGSEDKPVPNVSCPLCKGARFIHPRLPSGKPDFSRVVACRCTRQDAARELQEQLRNDGGLNLPLLKNMTFDNFDYKRANLPQEQQDNLEQAYHIALDFANSPEGWLILLGTTGCGKTHLAAAIANHQLKMGKPVKFVVVPDLLDHLRSSFNPDSKTSYDQLFEEVKNTPVLILDDFGEQSTTAWAEEKLYQIINHRYNARLATVITSTSSLDEIDGPISSRLVDPKISLVWRITAPDYRSDYRPSAKPIRRPRK